MSRQLLWSRGLEESITSPAVVLRRRRVSLCLLAVAALTALTATATYLWIAHAHRLAAWSSVMAVIIGTPIFVVFSICFFTIVRDPDRSNLWSSQVASITIVGTRSVDAVRQQCLVTLVEMGARLIEVNSNTLVAATGVQLSGLWLGNRLEVRIIPNHTGTELSRYTLTIKNTKLDYVTPNTCQRDIAEFRSAWLFEADAPAAGHQPHEADGRLSKHVRRRHDSAETASPLQ